MTNSDNKKKILVTIPCYNEEMTVGRVVSDFRRELPEAEILVVDNNSSDKTAEVARQSGATVIFEWKQGKGFAVRKIFYERQCDILIIVDGDDTYAAEDVHMLLNPLLEDSADMVVGNRIHKKNINAFTKSHWLGNKFFSFALSLLFRMRLKDIFSGFRAINREFMKTSILLSEKFEIESEISIQAIEKGLRVEEVDISLRPRLKNSKSKLKTTHDGVAILYAIISLFRDYKPLKFFSIISGIFLLAGLLLGWYSISDYLRTGLVLRLPSLLAASFFILSSFVSFTAGLILSSVKRRHDELMIVLRRNLKG